MDEKEINNQKYLHLFGLIFKNLLTIHGHMNIKFQRCSYILVSPENMILFSWCNVVLHYLLGCVIALVFM